MNCKIIDKPVLVLVGPTAVGKTDLSLLLAESFGCEIVSVDSMQVYRYMDIGTAKASKQERAAIPHHLIDIVPPDQDYDAAKFRQDALYAIEDIHKREKIPLLTGGTGLYLRALLTGLFDELASDPQIRNQLQERLRDEGCSKLHEELSLIDRTSAQRIHKNDTHRLLRALEIFQATGKPWSAHLQKQGSGEDSIRFKNILKIALTCEREKLYGRINQRTDIMLEQGLQEEVEGLLAMGYSGELKSMGAIGYRHMVNYLAEKYNYDEMKRLLARDTRRYAKRQYTWFSRIEDLQWCEVEETNEVYERVKKWLG